MLDIAQLHGFASEQAQRPVVVPVGRVAASNRDEVGLLRAAQRLASPFLALVAEHRVESATQKARTNVAHRVLAGAIGIHDLRASPARAEFEQDLGAFEGARVRLAALQEEAEALVVAGRQGDGGGNRRVRSSILLSPKTKQTEY